MTVTFYSYKGGVGRSMALMNVAEILVEAGYRVVICDFDLEAPGLERYACDSQREAKALEGRQGIIDLLTDYKDSLAAPSRSDSTFPELQSPLTIAVRLSRERVGKGWLKLLTVGRRDDLDPSYARRVQNFDWVDFYERWAGGSYLEFFRRSLDRFADSDEPAGRADIVLIDSRTGVTEHGGVSTHHLADLVVLLSAANDLNIQGTEWMASKLVDPELAKLRNRRPILTLPVAARIEQLAEKEQLVTFQSRFANTFANRLPPLLSKSEFFSDTEIPYVPFYSFTERVVARENPDRRHPQLYNAYLQISYAIVRAGIGSGLLNTPPLASWLPSSEVNESGPATYSFPRILVAHENWLTSGGKEGERASLAERDLRNHDLSGRNLKQADLRGCNLERANLAGADLTGSDLDHAVLDRAILTDAQISRARLTGASLRFADLSRATLTETDLTGAVLGQTVLHDVDLQSCLGLTRRQIAMASVNQSTKLPYQLRSEAAVTTKGGTVKQRYLAFISNHAAEEVVASSLQYSLERFGRPWFRRGKRIFHRKGFGASLTGGLESALLASEFFILLASPSAVASPAIGHELRQWLDNKGRDDILIVKIAGDISWDSAEGDFSESSTAVPLELRGVFHEEPRWIDLSWAHTQDQINPAYPQFQDVVADISAIITRVEKSQIIKTQARKQLWVKRAIAVGFLVLISSYIFAAEAILETARAKANLAAAKERLANAESRANDVQNQLLDVRRLNEELQRLVISPTIKPSVPDPTLTILSRVDCTGVSGSLDRSGRLRVKLPALEGGQQFDVTVTGATRDKTQYVLTLTISAEQGSITSIDQITKLNSISKIGVKGPGVNLSCDATPATRSRSGR
jgi:uncharacterized protein YjbI with pentapeptide repeats